MFEVSERYLAFGQNVFVREVAIPVGEVIEKIAEKYPCNDDVDLNISPRPTAFLSGLDALIGISFFLGGWAGTKFLDEIYDTKLGPVIKACLRSYIKKRGPDKKYSFSILARKKGADRSVLICCVGSSVEEIEASERHIPAVLDVAEGLLNSANGSSVYLYVIDNGRINLEPEVYQSYDGALEGLKRKYPAQLPKHIKQEIYPYSLGR